MSVKSLPLQQVAQGREWCRTLSAGRGDLRQELERSKASLEEAKKRGAVSSARGRQLRHSEAKADLLAEELEAVRGDCSRLVQLVR